jgi:t-SNARE complex subunit (syntaxin)
MEEGTQAQTLQDLTRINKEMNSLQDIYVSLSEVAGSQQGSLIDSVQSKLSRASQSATAAVSELARAKDRMDNWTKIKVYTVSGLAAVGLFIWIV